MTTIHSADDRARTLAESDERDLWHRYAEAMWRDGWNACLVYLADLIGGRVFPPRPGDLEVKRYGPGGRERAGDPRPGDFPGRAA